MLKEKEKKDMNIKPEKYQVGPGDVDTRNKDRPWTRSPPYRYELR